MPATLMAPEKAEKYEKNAGEFWDKFYSIHQNRFFKEWNCARTHVLRFTLVRKVGATS